MQREIICNTTATNTNLLEAWCYVVYLERALASKTIGTYMSPSLMVREAGDYWMQLWVYCHRFNLQLLVLPSLHNLWSIIFWLKLLMQLLYIVRSTFLEKWNRLRLRQTRSHVMCSCRHGNEEGRPCLHLTSESLIKFVFLPGAITLWCLVDVSGWPFEIGGGTSKKCGAWAKCCHI